MSETRQSLTFGDLTLANRSPLAALVSMKRAGATPKGLKAKKSKLASIFDQLEAANSTFLATAAASNAAVEARRSTAIAKTPAPPKSSTKPSFLPPTSIGKVKVDAAEAARRAERRQRFLLAQQAATSGPTKSGSTLVEAREAQGGAVLGQNQRLEKEYLRLTSLPGVEDVRPPAVLSRALELVRSRWKDGDCSYKHVCDQLKAIRQDLTVQHIRDHLTILVYETHCRIALEVGDWAELRQSLAVLLQLYAEHLEGMESCKKKERKRRQEAVAVAPEFTAYNILLAAATRRDVLAHELSEAQARGLLALAGSDDPCVSAALAAARAAGAGDFVALLRCYEGAPRMTPYLLDLLVEKSRPRAWAAILAGYGGPKGVPLSAVAVWLGFAGEGEAAEWIAERGGVVGEDGAVDVKASREGLRAHAAAAAAAAGTSWNDTGSGIR